MDSVRRLRRTFLDLLPTQDDKAFNAGPRVGWLYETFEFPYYEELHKRLWDKLLVTDEFTEVFNIVKAKYGKELFHELTGDVMYPKRGRRDPGPYKGMEVFLEDRAPRACPKMFSFILKKAAELTEERHPGHEYIIHYGCLKQAFILSARYKLEMLYKEHPWAEVFLSELRGHKLPMEEMDVMTLWRRKFPEGVEKAVEGLNAPAELWLGWGQLLTELEKIEAVVKYKKPVQGYADKGKFMIDFPERYRLSIGMGRRGGVKSKKP